MGTYVDANGISHGFVLTGGTFTTIDDPSSVGNTYAYGINDTGEIVGSYVANFVIDGSPSPGNLGFLYSAGGFTSLSQGSSAIPVGPSTVAYGMAPLASFNRWRGRSTAGPSH